MFEDKTVKQLKKVIKAQKVIQEMLNDQEQAYKTAYTQIRELLADINAEIDKNNAQFGTARPNRMTQLIPLTNSLKKLDEWVSFMKGMDQPRFEVLRKFSSQIWPRIAEFRGALESNDYKSRDQAARAFLDLIKTPCEKGILSELQNYCVTDEKVRSEIKAA